MRGCVDGCAIRRRNWRVGRGIDLNCAEILVEQGVLKVYTDGTRVRFVGGVRC